MDTLTTTTIPLLAAVGVSSIPIPAGQATLEREGEVSW